MGIDITCNDTCSLCQQYAYTYISGHIHTHLCVIQLKVPPLLLEGLFILNALGMKHSIHIHIHQVVEILCVYLCERVCTCV